jgi:Holliday junction DNA helicase RuvA
MITQLIGFLVERQPSHIVIDCNGVGYFVNISVNTYSKLIDEKKTLIYTHFIVREDQQLLYGFSEKTERTLFEKLISVNGVGPSSAMMMLSTLSINEIKNAILNSDDNLLKSVKGIGVKTAQRIIIDLKDKIEIGDSEKIITANLENKISFDALAALEVLGIPRKNATNAINKILSVNNDLSVEELVKETLKKI